MQEFANLMVDPDDQPWHRHPAWRWQRVLEYVVHQDPLYLCDEWVEEMSHMYTLTKSPEEHLKAMASAHPEAYDAFRINRQAHIRGGIRWQVEAMIMAGASNEHLNKRIPLKTGEAGFEMYRKIYFDVEDYLQSMNTVLSTVLATSFPQNHMLSDCDLVWKMIAYQKGLEAIDNVIAHCAGAPLDEELQLYMYQYSRSRALYMTYAAVSDHRIMYNEGFSSVLSLARNHFKFTDDLARDQEEKRTSSCVKELMSAVEYGLYKSDRKLPPQEVVDSFSLKVVDKKKQVS